MNYLTVEVGIDLDQITGELLKLIANKSQPAKTEFV